MARSTNPKSREALSRKFRVATAAAKRQGYSSFKAGSAGAHKRKEIAEAIAREGGVKPRRRRRY